jgi:hypothetical protein
VTDEVVNLRRARKAKARATHAAEGAANRVRSGLTRVVRERETMRREILGRRLDGHKLDDVTDGTDHGGRD